MRKIVKGLKKVPWYFWSRFSGLENDANYERRVLWQP